MKRHSLIRSSLFTVAALGLMASPVAAAAATAAAPVSPLVALSAFGTPESRAAVAAKPALLPATATATAVGAYQYEDDDRRGSSPLLALLLALGLVAAWFLLEDAVLGDDDGDLSFLPIPISPG